MIATLRRSVKPKSTKQLPFILVVVDSSIVVELLFYLR